MLLTKQILRFKVDSATDSFLSRRPWKHAYFVGTSVAKSSQLVIVLVLGSKPSDWLTGSSATIVGNRIILIFSFELSCGSSKYRCEFSISSHVLRPHPLQLPIDVEDAHLPCGSNGGRKAGWAKAKGLGFASDVKIRGFQRIRGKHDETDSSKHRGLALWKINHNNFCQWHYFGHTAVTFWVLTGTFYEEHRLIHGHTGSSQRPPSRPFNAVQPTSKACPAKA